MKKGREKKKGKEDQLISSGVKVLSLGFSGEVSLELIGGGKDQTQKHWARGQRTGFVLGVELAAHKVFVAFFGFHLERKEVRFNARMKKRERDSVPLSSKISMRSLFSSWPTNISPFSWSWGRYLVLTS